MGYYDFLLNQWSLNLITSTQVDNAVTKGYITAAQGTTIKNTVRN